LNWALILYALSIPAVVAVSGFLADYSRRHRQVAGGTAFMWLCILICLLAFLEGLSILAPTRQWALFWFDLRFVSLAALSVVWLIFVLQFTGHANWLTPRRIAVLFIIPIITQGMIWTNPFHSLWVTKPVAFHQAGYFFMAQTAERIPGIWMWVHFAYSYALVLTGITVSAVTWLRVDRRDRSQFFTVVLGTLIMAIAAALPAFRIFPDFTFNPLIPVIATGLLIIFWGVFRCWFLHSPLILREEENAPLALIALFVLLATGIMVTAYFYYQNYEKSYRTEVEHTLSSIAELKVDEIVQWRKERLADALVLHKNSAFAELARRVIENPADTGAGKRMRNWLSKIHEAYQYKNLILMSASGQVRQSAVPESPQVCDEIRKLIPEIRQSRKVIFLDFHREVSDRSISLSVLAPIEDEGRFLGTVALVIDPNIYLYPRISRWPTPSKTAETLLVRREGNEVVFLNELKFQKGTALKLRFPLLQNDLPASHAARGEQGIIKGKDYRGESVVAALRSVPDSPWFMVARMDRDEIYAPIRRQLLLMIFMAGVFIFGAAAVIWIFWQRQRNIHYRRELASAEALMASEIFLDSIIEHSPHSMWISDDKGTSIRLNQACRDLFHISDEEVVGKYNMFTDSILEKQGFLPQIKNVFEKGETARFTLLYDTADLQGLPFEHAVSLILEVTISAVLNKGKVAHAIIQHVNVTERERAQEAMRESEDKFRYMFDNSVVGKSITQPDGRVTVNKAFSDLLGYPQDELCQLRWQDITHPDDVALTQQAVDNILSGKVFSTRFTKRFIHKNGSAVWADLSSFLRRDGNGKPLYFMSTILDITERMQTQEAIHKLNEELEERVAKRTAELSAKNEELERLNRVFVDRELRMRELKARIEELEKKT